MAFLSTKAIVWPVLAIQIFAHFTSGTMETDVSVDCHSDPDNMVVMVETNIPFDGMLYVSDKYGDPSCTIRGRKNKTTILKVPFHGCNTVEKSPGLFMSHVTVQQHQMIVSAGDGEYEVGCKMFRGDLQVDTSNHMDVNIQPKVKPIVTLPDPGPEVLLRIYDFENDVFVETVRLGQVVELEIAIRDGRKYQGRVSDCDALNANGTKFPVVRNYCPVDLSVSDKVYVDDQSRTTGDFYLYIPFRVFRFLDGSRVHFTCNVIVCQHECPWADCGDYLGMSYGRKRRSTNDEDHVTLTVSNQVTVVDEERRTPRSSGQGIVEEEILPAPPKIAPAQKTDAPQQKSKLPMEYLIGGTSLVFALIVSISVNIYLIVLIRRRIRDDSSRDGDSSTSLPEAPCVRRSSSMHALSRYDYLYDASRYDPKPEWRKDTREFLYPPMPIRSASSARRSQSFRY